VDIRGAIQLKEKYPHVHVFFLQTTTLAVLESRLRKRAQNDEQALQTRLRNAQEEIQIAKDSSKVDRFLINDDFSEMFTEARKYIETRMV
ncbi:MAG: guanylate kinase, partial [Minisyncoccia bacterium]